jgi:hypothetical protein
MFTPPCARLLILACSATKTADTGRIPAIDRYDGPLWRTLRHSDPDGRKARLAVLSARHGFLEGRWPIENYDCRLTEQVAARMIAEVSSMRWPPPRRLRGDLPEGEHPGMQIARMVRRGDRPIEDVTLVGGWLYLRVMRTLVSEFQASRKVAANACVVEINAPIGIMRRDLRAWLDESARDPWTAENSAERDPSAYVGRDSVAAGKGR